MRTLLQVCLLRTAHSYNMILMWAFSRKVLTQSAKYFSISCCCKIRRISGAAASKERASPLRRLHHLHQLNPFLGQNRGHLFRFQFIQVFGQPRI